MIKRLFQNGDVVCLKSEDFKMTVLYYDWYCDEYKCVWMNDRGRLKGRRFKECLLKKADEGSN